MATMTTLTSASLQKIYLYLGVTHVDMVCLETKWNIKNYQDLGIIYHELYHSKLDGVHKESQEKLMYVAAYVVFRSRAYNKDPLVDFTWTNYCEYKENLLEAEGAEVTSMLAYHEYTTMKKAADEAKVVCNHARAVYKNKRNLVIDSIAKKNQRDKKKLFKSHLPPNDASTMVKKENDDDDDYVTFHGNDNDASTIVKTENSDDDDKKPAAK
jgi:hypothetical protein